MTTAAVASPEAAAAAATAAAAGRAKKKAAGMALPTRGLRDRGTCSGVVRTVGSCNSASAPDPARAHGSPRANKGLRSLIVGDAGDLHPWERDEVVAGRERQRHCCRRRRRGTAGLPSDWARVNQGSATRLPQQQRLQQQQQQHQHHLHQQQHHQKE